MGSDENTTATEPRAHLPLMDVRVLAVEQYGAGPWGTSQLTELGADVIKIEDPRVGGDVGRYVPPFAAGEDSLFFETFNGGKRSIALDLKNDAGVEVFHRLVQHADVVFSNLRGDQPARLGLRFADLGPVNPTIVCCSLSGYGQDGPRATSGALDYVVQGLTGWMTVGGEPGAPPARMGLSLVDYAGGYVSAIAILGGLLRARRDGIGCDCDISLQETALSLLTYLGTWAATRGYVPPRRPNSAHPSIVPFQNFETSDGWIVVACPKQDLWERLCRAIERPELLDDPDYSSLTLRDQRRDVLLGTLEATFRGRTTHDWVARLEAVGVPVGRINGLAEALVDPQVIAREGVDAYQHDRFGEVRRIRSALRLSGPRRVPERAPRLGEHTDVVLAEVGGYGPDEIRSLAARGAFGAV